MASWLVAGSVAAGGCGGFLAGGGYGGWWRVRWLDCCREPLTHLPSLKSSRRRSISLRLLWDDSLNQLCNSLHPGLPHPPFLGGWLGRWVGRKGRGWPGRGQLGKGRQSWGVKMYLSPGTVLFQRPSPRLTSGLLVGHHVLLLFFNFFFYLYSKSIRFLILSFTNLIILPESDVLFHSFFFVIILFFFIFNVIVSP